MTYYTNILGFFRFTDDHLYRIGKAEEIKNQWKTTIFLILFSLFLYTFMAYFGMGTNLISEHATTLTTVEYEVSKFWFVVGRTLFGGLFALLILFVPSLLFYLLTDIPYQKLLIMQQIVLTVMLIERIIWIPLALFIGLDWYVSPLSFGIIASYLTDTPWIIAFFGSISLFQLWVIWFQGKFIMNLSATKKYIIWINIILLHIFGWCFAALFAYSDSYLISGWFN
ncbi:hypothetical protein [Oceanobacillus senegalensis]|uniref:hypothetical protein n=1 Tax=Oceanobacillus senegalensis TaxID=1936063 RepID=UPI000A30AF97|nr:hypothetical protein [Oceanobacillus senegalensis]